MIVVTALRGRSLLFGIAFWAALAAVAAACVHAVLRIRKGWLTVEQAARFADRRAVLEDRLSTLLTTPRRSEDSRLHPMLVAQVVAATPRWDVRALTPRRVPRSLFALLGAMAVLIATSFYARPPRPPESHAAAAARPASVAEEEIPVPQPGGNAVGALAASRARCPWEGSPAPRVPIPRRTATAPTRAVA